MKYTTTVADYLTWRGDIPFSVDPFNEVDNLVLCIIAYINLRKIDRLWSKNPKDAMPIGDGVYLMTHTTCPAILVECGFLSSPQETALLQQPSYQMKIAAVIAAGYCQYCTSEGTT